MTHIPKRFDRLFETPVALSDKDSERLRPYLSHWGVLNARFRSGVNESDLKRLILLELSSESPRKRILDRLLMRLGRVQRRSLSDKIERLIS
jgi:hypothetical protein